MQVIGAGLPRTGTLSQKVALEKLGFGPCYHMVNILGDLTQGPRWQAVDNGDLDVREILDPFKASVDWPGAAFWEETAALYPDAKIILSTRDPESWARSMRNTVWGLFYDDCLIRHLSDARGFVDQPWADFMETMRKIWMRTGLLDEQPTTLDTLARAIERHNANVIKTIAPERLLVWSVTEGWGPLCEFLDVPVPEGEFPRVNDAQEFVKRIIDQALAALGQISTEQLTTDILAA